MKTRNERLSIESNIWFACTRADGRPHLTPIWFVWVSEQIWLCTQHSAVKAAIVSVRPSVSVALEDASAPVTGQGSAELVEVAVAPGAVADAFQTKYAWAIGESSENVLIKVSIDRWLQPSDTVEVEP